MCPPLLFSCASPSFQCALRLQNDFFPAENYCPKQSPDSRLKPIFLPDGVLARHSPVFRVEDGTATNQAPTPFPDASAFSSGCVPNRLYARQLWALAIRMPTTIAKRHSQVRTVCLYDRSPFNHPDGRLFGDSPHHHPPASGYGRPSSKQWSMPRAPRVLCEYRESSQLHQIGHY